MDLFPAKTIFYVVESLIQYGKGKNDAIIIAVNKKASSVDSILLLDFLPIDSLPYHCFFMTQDFREKKKLLLTSLRYLQTVRENHTSTVPHTNCLSGAQGGETQTNLKYYHPPEKQVYHY